jgi:membrane fusion protein (multidrug efflux system)
MWTSACPSGSRPRSSVARWPAWTSTPARAQVHRGGAGDRPAGGCQRPLGGLRGCIDNRSLQLRPGMFARVNAVFGERDDARVIPEEAIVPQGGRQFVLKLVDGPDGDTKMAQRVEVQGRHAPARPVEITERAAARRHRGDCRPPARAARRHAGAGGGPEPSCRWGQCPAAGGGPRPGQPAGPAAAPQPAAAAAPAVACAGARGALRSCVRPRPGRDGGANPCAMRAAS